MSEYHFNEGAFEIPATGVIDRSTTALEVQVAEGKRLSVVVARQPRGELSLDDIVRDTVKALGVSLRRFRGSPPRRSTIQGFRAAEIDLTWVHETGPMFHQLAILELEDVALTVTVAGTEELRPQVVALFKMVVSSLKIRRRR